MLASSGERALFLCKQATAPTQPQRERDPPLQPIHSINPPNLHPARWCASGLLHGSLHVLMQQQAGTHGCEVGELSRLHRQGSPGIPRQSLMNTRTGFAWVGAPAAAHPALTRAIGWPSTARQPGGSPLSLTVFSPAHLHMIRGAWRLALHCIAGQPYAFSPYDFSSDFKSGHKLCCSMSAASPPFAWMWNGTFFRAMDQCC